MSIQQSSQDSIQVHIRIRATQPIYFEHSEEEIKLGKNSFLFDRIYSSEIDQGEVFKHTGLKSINHAMEGYNSCIFVYGQTGSGKTYTMVGGDGGIIQKAMEHLFYKISQVESGDYIVGCSYYEIYNEQLYDLLDNSQKKKLNIRQDIKKGIFIEGLYEQNIDTSIRGMSLLNQGIRSRHVAQTQMNRQSSRSHAIFTLNIQSKHIHNGSTTLKTSKLHFVDLAGSQRQKTSACLGQRLKEASNINKSLTTLGMVINSLSSQKPKSHIPFRDSKLTLVLRDSLNGNSKTYLIATISSNPDSFQQTLSTLKFAQRAKMVKLKAQINEQSLSNNVQNLKQQIKRLKQQNRCILSDLEVQKSKLKSNQMSNFNETILSNYTNNVIEINKKIDSLVELLPQAVEYMEDKQTMKVVNNNLDEIIQLREQILNKANVGNLKLNHLSSRKQNIKANNNSQQKINENNQIQNSQAIPSNQENQIISTQQDKLITLLKQKINTCNAQQPLIKQLSNQIISLKKSLNSIQNQYSSLSQHHNLLKTNYKSLEQQSSIKIQSILYQNQRMKKQLQTINQKKNDQTLTCSINGQQISIASLSIKMRQLENVNQQLNSEIDIIRQTVQFKDQQINSLKQNIEKYKFDDIKIKLELELKSTVADLTAYKQQIEYLKKVNDDNRKNNAASLSMLDKITTQHENLIQATKQIQVQLKKKIEELNEQIRMKTMLLETEKEQNRNRFDEVRRIEQKMFDKQASFQRSLLEKSDLEQSLKSTNKLEQDIVILRQKFRLTTKQLDQLKIARDFYMNSLDSLEVNCQAKMKEVEQLRKINQDLSLKNNRYQSVMKQREDDMLLLHNELVGKKEEVIEYAQKLKIYQKQYQQIQSRLTQSALKHENQLLSLTKQNQRSSVSNFYSPSHFSSPIPSSSSSSIPHLQQIQQLKRIIHERDIQNSDIFRLKKEADYKVYLQRQQCNKSLGQKMKQISQLKEKILELQMQAFQFQTIKNKYHNLLQGKTY